MSRHKEFSWVELLLVIVAALFQTLPPKPRQFPPPGPMDVPRRLETRKRAAHGRCFVCGRAADGHRHG